MEGGKKMEKEVWWEGEELKLLSGQGDGEGREKQGKQGKWMGGNAQNHPFSFRE